MTLLTTTRFPGASVPADRAAGVGVSYAAGAFTALAGQNQWLLADARPDDPAIADLWRLSERAPVDDISNEVIARGTAGRLGRGFVLGQMVDGGLAVSLAGTAIVDLDYGVRVERLGCPAFIAVAQYRCLRVPMAMTGEIESGAEITMLPFTTGVVSAGCIRVVWADPAPSVVGLAEDLHEPHAEDAADLVSSETMVPYDTSRAAVTMTPNRSDGDPADTVLPNDALEGSGPAETGSGYDYLFGHTVHRSVPDAAVHAIDAEGDDVIEAPVAPAAGAPRPAPETTMTRDAELGPPPQSVRPPTSGPIVRARSTGMIDSVPWAEQSGPREPAVAESESAPDDSGDDPAVGLTVSRAKLKEIAAQADAAKDAGPSVHAVRCPAGHPNPAHAESCRVCGEAIADQAPITVPRPVLGVLRFSTGDVITLDRGVLIGRSPSKARTQGKDRPHIVKLPSPDHDISRDHLEIRLDDWHVLLTDLNSTNGTMVTRAGREPERLRPDQATPIEPGSVVTLAEVVTFIFEAVD